MPLSFIHAYKPAFLRSSGIFLSTTIELHKSVTHLAPASPYAFNVYTTPDGTADLPTPMTVLAASTSCTKIHSAVPPHSTTSQSDPSTPPYFDVVYCL